MYVLGMQNSPQTLSVSSQEVAFPLCRVRRVCSDQADARSGKAAKKKKERMVAVRLDFGVSLYVKVFSEAGPVRSTVRLK